MLIHAAEHWKPIRGYEGIYEVSDCGRVKSLSEPKRTGTGVWCMSKERVKRLNQKSDGYLLVSLSKNNKTRALYIHYLVLLEFVGLRPEGMECCHNNGIRNDNRLSNLRYGTKIDNAADRLAHGHDQRNEKNGRCKLTNEKVFEVVRLKNNGVSNKTISIMYGISPDYVRDLQTGRSRLYLQREAA